MVPSPGVWRRTAVVLGVAFIVIFAAALVLIQYEQSDWVEGATVTLQTWTQWGMSIGHPWGLTAQGQGVYQQLATSESGIVTWTWNGGNTSLYLEWIPASASNYSSGFQGVPVRLQSNTVTGITAVGQGNVSMAGATWEYRSERLTFGGGSTIYVTSASSYYPSSQRGYIVAYVDTNPNTLESLETYGNTFHG
jgi:hypothetical protein